MKKTNRDPPSPSPFKISNGPSRAIVATGAVKDWDPRAFFEFKMAVSVRVRCNNIIPDIGVNYSDEFFWKGARVLPNTGISFSKRNVYGEIVVMTNTELYVDFGSQYNYKIVWA